MGSTKCKKFRQKFIQLSDIIITGTSSGIAISGTVGTITGGAGGVADNGYGSEGIVSNSGAVEVSGKVGAITGGGSDMQSGGNGISASSYSVLDYTTTGNLDPANCVPTGGHTVAFNYSGVTGVS